MAQHKLINCAQPNVFLHSKSQNNCSRVVQGETVMILQGEENKIFSLFFLTVMKRRFKFNLSFQQGYGVYKLSHATMSHNSPPIEKPAYHSLFNCDFPNAHHDALQSGALSRLGPNFDFSTTCPVDSSSHADLLLEAVDGGGEALADCAPLPHENHGNDEKFCCVPSLASHHREQDHSLTDTSSVFEGPERRLSHEECRKIELTDWEWCRSKSERTPRQVHQHSV